MKNLESKTYLELYGMHMECNWDQSCGISGNKWSGTRWTWVVPVSEVGRHAVPNDDAERVAWLRGDTPSSTSEEEVGNSASSRTPFIPWNVAKGTFFPMNLLELQHSVHKTKLYPGLSHQYKNIIFHCLWSSLSLEVIIMCSM
jgi:hypothetical protein